MIIIIIHHIPIDNYLFLFYLYKTMLFSSSIGKMEKKQQHQRSVYVEYIYGEHMKPKQTWDWKNRWKKRILDLDLRPLWADRSDFILLAFHLNVHIFSFIMFGNRNEKKNSHSFSSLGVCVWCFFLSKWFSGICLLCLWHAFFRKNAEKQNCSSGDLARCCQLCSVFAKKRYFLGIVYVWFSWEFLDSSFCSFWQNSKWQTWATD